MKIKTILVTGVAGFVGTNLTAYLLLKGYNVIGIDNFDNNYAFILKNSNIIKLLSLSKKFRFYSIDIRDKNQLNATLKDINIDVIIHLAAKSGVIPSIKYIDDYLEVNVLGTKNILEFMKAIKCFNIIFASSSSVYGNNQLFPFKEDSPVQPLTPYASSKMMGENLTYNYHFLFGFSVLNLRFFNVYGPCGRPDSVIYKFTNSALKNEIITIFGDGCNKRDWTYIDNVVSAIEQGIVLLSNSSVTTFETINIGNSEPIMLNQIIELIEHHLCMKFSILYKDENIGDIKSSHADISKARTILNYEPQVKIDEGIEKFIYWFKNDAANKSACDNFR